MRIGLVSTNLTLRSSGMTSFLVGLTAHLCEAGQEITVVTSDLGHRGDASGPIAELDGRVPVSVFPTESALNRRLYRAVGLRQWLARNVSQFDVIHIQGLWSFVTVHSANICARQNVPYIITPHGHTAREDWQRRPVAKTLFFAALCSRVWKRAAAIHFLSKGELENSVIESKGRTVVVPNAVSRPPLAGDPALALQFRQKFAIPLAAPIVLFIGRLHEHKGVAEIIDAFQLLRERGCDAALVLVGSGDARYTRILAQKAESANRASWIRFTGPLYGQDKWGAFAAASAFITLSKCEGHPIAPLEALSCGVPVVLTEKCNIPEVAQYRAGLIVKRDHVGAADALQQILSDGQLARDMAVNAFRLVEDRFSWRSVLPQMLNLYRAAVNPI
jgi:glycosyltransferase involved in cell wall biosynthesis